MDRIDDSYLSRYHPHRYTRVGLGHGVNWYAQHCFIEEYETTIWLDEFNVSLHMMCLRRYRHALDNIDTVVEKCNHFDL